MSRLALECVSFRWSDSASPLFPAISLELDIGSVVTVMGENGSGKTTLLEIIAGRRPPSEGRVTVDGLTASPDQFNYLPQDHARLLFPHLTIEQNVALRRDGSGSPNSGSEDSLLRALFPDRSVLQRFPSRCSGGQRQRAALSRAVLEIPYFPVTVLDEPFSQLSHEAKVSLLPAIRDHVLASQNVTVVVSHDLLDSMILGDRVVTLTASEVLSHDTSGIRTGAEFWHATALRESILRNTHGFRVS